MAVHTITLTAEEEEAIASHTQAHNTANGTVLSTETFLQQEISGFLRIYVQAYRDRIKARLGSRYDEMTPEERLLWLAQGSVVLP
jgi:hypothetical protein